LPARAEIRSLTGLRGVAAVYVMLYHYLSSQRHDSRNLLDHGYLAVDLFFVLSGFVMGLIYAEEFRYGATRAAFLSFLGRRIARVYPLYLFVTVLAAILIALGLLDLPGGHLPLELLLNLLMVQSWFHHFSLDSPSWSISAEWGSYLVFPWLATIILSKKRWLLALTLISAIALVPISLPPDRILSLGIPLTRCLSAFILGLFTYRMTLEPGFSRLREIPWLEPLVCAIYVAILCLPRCDIAAVLFSPLLIFVLSSDRWIVSRMLRTHWVHRLGVLSFSLYLIHDMFSAPMGWIHHTANAHGLPHGQLIAAAVAIPVSIGLAELTCRWVEIPGRRAVRHFVKEETAKAPVAR